MENNSLLFLFFFGISDQFSYPVQEFMLKNDTLNNGTSRIGLYGSAPRVTQPSNNYLKVNILVRKGDNKKRYKIKWNFCSCYNFIFKSGMRTLPNTSISSIAINCYIYAPLTRSWKDFAAYTPFPAFLVVNFKYSNAFYTIEKFFAWFFVICSTDTRLNKLTQY